MKLRTCRYCGESYPADEPDLWRSRNQCVECYNRAANERYYISKAKRIAEHKEADPLLVPARIRLTRAWSSCDYCAHCQECREHVQNGRQVLCAPIHRSDILLEKAYMARKAEHENI